MRGQTLLFGTVVLIFFSQSYTAYSLPLLNRFRHKTHQTVKAATYASDVTLIDADSLLEEAGNAGIALAARQGLFDYSIGVAFMFLSQKLQGQNVPDVSKRFSIPIVGNFDLQLTNIVVTNFACDASNSNLFILGDGFFHLLASDIAANLTFQWHWTKGGLSGSGEGELLLSGGTIDWVYDVHKDEQLQKPQLQVVTANSNFDTVQLKIHSYSADWLYQAVLTLFNEAVKRQVQNGVAAALDKDVPERINAVLGSLPTRLEVHGLPFSASFEYSIYTASFVLVKGFGEVEVPAEPSPSEAAAAAVVAAALPQGFQESRRRLRGGEAAAAAAAGAADVLGSVAQMMECPFETSGLPVDGAGIAADPRMVSIFVHEATANCLLWGLYRSGKLNFSLRDGSIPGLSITTDILALLVPELPTRYPHMKMVIAVQALDTPTVSFTPSAGATVSAFYRLSLVVANDTLGNPEVVRLAANLTVSAAFDWDTTTIGDVTAHHVVELSELSVPAEQWDNTVTWLIQNYGGLTSLRQVVELLVKTPIASMVSLANTQATTWDRWYGMSADIELRLPPPPPVSREAAVPNS